MPTDHVEKVLLAAPRGFCAGVEMAIKALAWMVRAFEPPVYCYHEIVHNQLVVQRFEASGVVFVDDVSDAPEGRPIMLSAHGSAPEVVAAAIDRGGYVVDAVCPLVTKVHHEVKTRVGKGLPDRLCRARGPRGGGGDDGRRTGSHPPRRDRRRRRRPARVRLPHRGSGPDHAVAPRMGRGARRRATAVPAALGSPNAPTSVSPRPTGRPP